MPRPTPEEMQKQVERFNAKRPGCVVYRSSSNAEPVIGIVVGDAYVMEGHTAVVFLAGISGCVALGQCREAKEMDLHRFKTVADVNADRKAYNERADVIAYREFYSGLSKEGDPERVPNKFMIAFLAGWAACQAAEKGRAELLETLDEAVKVATALWRYSLIKGLVEGVIYPDGSHAEIMARAQSVMERAAIAKATGQ